MAESDILIFSVVILLGFSFMTSMYLSWSIGTPYGVDFPLGRYFWHNGNYTVSQDFTTNNVSLNGIGEKDIEGKWRIDANKGLYPEQLINTNLIPFITNYEARCTFGNVRYINNSWTEKYYLNNINKAPNDYVGIIIRQGSNFNLEGGYAPASYELLLEIRGDKVGLKENNYFAGVNLGGNYFQGFTIANGTTSGNISYKAVLGHIYLTDPANNENEALYDVILYWNDQYMCTIPWTSFQQINGVDVTRQADIRTNIGAPNAAYELNVLSHYEDVSVQKSAEYGTDGYDDVSKFLIVFGDVLLWGLPLETPIPSWLLMFFIGIPEFAIAYTGFRLLRGGG